MVQRSEKAERWRRLFERQRGSGLSAAAFCRHEGIPESSYFAWRRRLSEEMSFAEVKVLPEPSGGTGAIELHLPGERRVLVGPGFDRQTLVELLRALDEHRPPTALEVSA